MLRDNYLQIRRQEAIRAATGIIEGTVDSIVAIRTIVSIGSDFPAVFEFENFRGWESDTDEFPRGLSRARYNSVYLQELDSASETYLAEVKADLKKACSQLIKALSGVKL